MRQLQSALPQLSRAGWQLGFEPPGKKLTKRRRTRMMKKRLKTKRTRRRRRTRSLMRMRKKTRK